MLRFQTTIDETFKKIISTSLEMCIGELQEDLDDNYPNFCNCYFEEMIRNSFGRGIEGVKLIHHELKRLLQHHLAEELYMPTDRHFQLLHRVLYHWTELYNDDDEDVYAKITYKGKRVYRIDFDILLDIYFWDLDFDFAPEVAFLMKYNKEKAENMDLSPEAINASLGELVDHSDLVFERWESDKKDSGDREGYVDDEEEDLFMDIYVTDKKLLNG